MTEEGTRDTTKDEDKEEGVVTETQEGDGTSEEEGECHGGVCGQMGSKGREGEGTEGAPRRREEKGWT